MKLKLFISFSLLLPLFFTSCTKVVDFDGNTPEHLLVMNCIATPDSVVTVQLSKSKFFLSTSSEFQNVSNATVEMTLNGDTKVKLKNMDNGLYESDVKVKSNDLIQISASAPNLKAVTSSVFVQPKIVILSIDTMQVRLAGKSALYTDGFYNGSNKDTAVIGYASSLEIKVKIRFQEDAKEQNYYRVNVYQVARNASSKNFQAGLNYYNSNVDYNDVVFGNHTKDNASLDFNSESANNLFGDEIINGKEYVLSVKTIVQVKEYLPGKTPSSEIVEGPQDLMIDFQQLSKSYYLYYKTTLASNSGNYFSEPVQIYNNIKDGLGILGSYSHAVTTFKLD
jgi:hypothetical protein